MRERRGRYCGAPAPKIFAPRLIVRTRIIGYKNGCAGCSDAISSDACPLAPGGHRMTDAATLAVELDVLAAKAGIAIQHDRREAILAGYQDVKRLAALLRTVEITPADEPANIYTFANIVRGA